MILNGTGDNLQAFMSGAAATTNPSYFITYADINSTTSALTPDSAGGALNGVTDVNLLTGASGEKRMVKNLAICNVDTADVTVTVQFEDGTDRPIQSAVVIPVGKTLYWSIETGWVIQPAAVSGTFRGARAYTNTDQTLTTATNTALTFDLEVYDTDDIHDLVTNNSRMTVPAGVTKVRLTANCGFDANATGDVQMTIQKNGAVTLTEPFARLTSLTASADPYINISSGVMEVSGGDYFEAFVRQASGGNLNTAPVSPFGLVWFSMEVVE